MNMLLDGHIHVRDGVRDREGFLSGLKDAGVDGGVVISLPPASFPFVAEPRNQLARIDDLFYWCGDEKNLYPFYWLDPLEEDAEEQVAAAVERGVAGFKVICDRYYAGDQRPLEIFTAIAEAGLPILFHSGILWDGKASSIYNLPSNFEALLEVEGLRFSLAHVAWPWCDELIAVYGKMLNAYNSGSARPVEMFIDLTPGTPTIYRREVLTKLFSVGYDVANNVIFGTDCSTIDYNVKWTKEWLERDQSIYHDLQLDPQTIQNIFSDNLKRFVGVITEKPERQLPKVAQ